jgi:phosphoribosylamine--glycine ligase
MGTYAPAPVITPDIMDRVKKEILEPMVEAMNKEGRPYKGCLYAGLMITDKGPKVVEFNARFGDPETQVVLPLLKSDLVEVMLACIDGTLDKTPIEWSDGAAVCVVMASGGYPGSYEKGKEITGLDAAKADGDIVFHAGTKNVDGKIVTNGGRVLGVVGQAENIKAAVDKAYEGVKKISFDKEYHRTDIAHRALERL